MADADVALGATSADVEETKALKHDLFQGLGFPSAGGEIRAHMSINIHQALNQKPDSPLTRISHQRDEKCALRASTRTVYTVLAQG